MNQLLHDYVRGAHFHMSLSERQIEALLILNTVGYGGWLASKAIPNAGSAGVVQIIKLEQKGLIERPEFGQGWLVTKAGVLVSQLLLEAGYEVPAFCNDYKGSETNGTAEQPLVVA